MKLNLLLSLIFFVFYSQADEDRRISGGEVAFLGQFPHHAHIKIYFETFFIICGGSLVKHNWVVTAAHCVSNFEYRYIEVLLGLVNRNDQPEYLLRVENRDHVRYHPLYDPPDNLSNDIALIYLEDAEPSILSNPYVGKIDLPVGIVSDFVGYQVTATGFGITNDSDPNPSETLNFVSMPVISNEECITRLPSEIITSETFCTNTIDERSTCPGDNGGGAFTTIESRRILIGIASLYVDQCQIGVPAIFTRVTEFINWLEENFDNPPEIEIPLPTLPPSQDGCNCECICETCPNIQLQNRKKNKEL
ncbi:hypothetical protein PVAND_017547 [Polypedilum vanderplanki]|uniref:Peptidase S1 domain-containing protein n=1 Tax=Polypedilum vanderplanki TaxID=319348 RepID=A0A9J6BJ00_POLVA|nr:hypothetical protein PVAND_017547 [Polypedilum vanderplanki]